MPPTYDTFFQAATGHAPYAYQRRLACGEHGRTAGGEPSQISNLSSAMRERPASCTSRLISIPTGLGKTAPDPSQLNPSNPTES